MVSVCYMLLPFHPSVCLSVRQMVHKSKMVEVRIVQFSPSIPLVFAG